MSFDPLHAADRVRAHVTGEGILDVRWHVPTLTALNDLLEGRTDTVEIWCTEVQLRRWTDEFAGRWRATCDLRTVNGIPLVVR